MDSYNLFGDDGSGMLEGLTDLGGTDSFAGNSASGVAVDNKDTADNSFRQPYTQSNVAQDSSIQKLASFGGGGAGGITNSAQPVPPPAGPPAADYHEYGNYPPRPRLPQPPHAPLHPSHHVLPSHSYPGYHAGPDPMYSMPEQSGIGDMGVWSGAPGANRYGPITPVYRHSYEHQQKIHQYSPQQTSSLGLQSQNGAYLPRQPHFSQPPSQQLYGQQQSYPNYTQMHPPSAPRLSQHPTYHQQMDVNPHQYGIPHGQQSHSLSQHPPHQSIGSHAGSIQNHPNVHLHHSGAPPLHHVPRQPPGPSSSVAPAHPANMPYASPHHGVPMNYQSHQVQHPLDVNVTNQYNPVKSSGIETGSPQYRPPFPQLSPQMSPRAQMSPRQQQAPQLSPRPVMSPVKGPSASPHASRNVVQSPVSSGPPQPAGTFSSQNTLQALEQMVLPPGSEYSYQRNPSSPAVGHVGSSPSQWSQNKIPTPINQPTTLETSDQSSKEPVVTKTEMVKSTPVSVPNNDSNNLNKLDMEHERKSTEISPSHMFLTPASVNSVPKENLTTTTATVSPAPAGHPITSCGSTEMETPEKMHNPSLKNESDTDVKEEKIVEKNKDNNTLKSDHIQEINQQIGDKKCSNETLGLNISVPTTSTKSSVNVGTEIAQNQMHLPPPHSITINTSPNSGTQYENQGTLNSNRNQSFQGNNIQNVPPSLSNVIPHNIPSSVNIPASMSSSLQNNATNNVPSSFPSVTTPGTISVPTGQSSHTLAQVGIANTVSSSMPVHNQQINSNSISNMQQTGMPNIPSTLPMVSTSANTNLSSVPVPMQMSVSNMHSNMGPTMQAISNMSHNIPHNPNIIMMGPNPIAHSSVPSIYHASHHQERMGLQQQIQEIYCLPPSNENQEKVRCLQERLVLLQQHETNEKCNGGPNCILQNPLYGSKMIESPQVTSTTGRGRGKGPAKPRKPRVKKDKNTAAASLDQLPVSEDCVTAGTGLHSNSELDLEMSEDLTNLDSSAISIDELGGGKAKKPRGPRKNKEKKPRTPKEPKIPKQPGDKPVKERKKREPRDPNAPKRKRNTKKDASEMLADTTTSYDFLEKGSLDNSSETTPINLHEVSKSATSSEFAVLDDSNVTDFDDIPVSKIPIKELLEEAEAKRECDRDDESESISQKKRTSRKRSSICGSGRKSSLKRTPGGRRKKRGGLVPDSDGEPDDMMATPPPSPPPEADDSLKRRSARNTQRKKYTDDVMLRLSDDEFTMTASKIEKECKADDILETKEIVKAEGTPKLTPNYMYVNTTEEDSMIVQHVLASRMGKRELKHETPSEVNKSDNVSNSETTPTISDENKSQLQSTTQLLDKPDVESSVDKPIPSPELKVEDVKDNIEEPQIQPDPKVDDDKQVEIKNKKPVMVDVEEYYVKYRNFSYLHCEWKTEEELYKGDKRIFSKIKRFKQKQAQQMNIFELLDDEPFNPDYIEVERILDLSENQDPANNSVVKHYLVKWKSLQYEDSTWELEEDIDVDKIKQYKIFSEIPSKDKWKYKKRPSADHWVQLKESPLYKGGNTLRPYQLEGLNWLLFSWHNNRNCILADEMGLGKTIQSLTFVNSVWEYGIRGPFLIIAPLSTIPNWQREFEGWTEMNVIVYHGSQQSKSMIQEYEFYYKNEEGEPIKEITKFNVLITTFEIIVTDFQELKSFNWRICVIDEAHRLKNRNCKLLEGLRQLHLEHRVLLSGTPLQNNVNELFSLLNFLEPSQFSSSDAFLNEFGQLKTESEVIKLQALLKPMMLRRLKEDVEKTLAPKEETIIEVELTNIQKKYYRAILERNFSFLQKGTASAANIPNLMNTMMELRKCCIHPYLLNGAEDQIQFDYKQTYGEDKEAYYKALIQSSGKMVLVDKLLPKLKAGGHRVLIFSQMVRCLDILEDYLLYRKYPFERIDGRIRGNLRQEAIDRFSKPDSDRFVFLLCTKAGGLGINLTAADTVIIYDSDWNPQNDLQAQARCHRIGQQKMVKIYRLICRNTYEREMFDKASLKLGLDKAILQSMNTTQGKETGLKQLSKKEIEDLLKKGAYGAVMDEDNAGDKFCEEDIEMILARRTQVIQMESEKGSTFSKASFAATDQRSDIDIRDPDFWNKWAKKAEIDTTEKKEDEDLIVTEPRKRTIIKRYGHDDGPMEMSDMEVTPDSEEDEEGISLRSKKKKEKFGRKGRRYASDDYIPRHEGVPVDEEVVYGSWTRSECFKIERGLLTFGWARWEEIVDKNQFRKGWTIPVIEDCARIIVLYCLRHYKGDEKIRNFIWDLIEPCENGEVTISRNHSGLHNPVPRGRNAKKKNKPKDVPKLSDIQKWEDPNHWSSIEKYDCEAYLESSYKKHLFRHANKVLLRVRMMYYIKHEVIGDYATQIENGVHASTLGMRVPRGVDSTPPRLWWDTECDVSLLVGTYIHGYENYLAMRSDPQLCFVDKLGPPDDAECTDIKSEERKVRGSVVGDEDCTDDVSSGAGATSPAASPRADDEPGGGGPWPSMQDLNTRLRRLITAYQRNYKREELKMQQRAKKMERRERMDQLARDEIAQWRWSRADEEAFRRTVASYGVEFDPATKSLRWSRFRTLARLDSKSDDALTDYLKAFMAMCKRQCGLSVGEAELPTRADLKAEPIGEERAIATLERIDLLRVLREEVAPHPALDARLALCERSPDTPPWWQSARHDKLLVLGVCKHGLGDTYNKLFCDPKLPFADCANKWYSTHKGKSEAQKATSDDDDNTEENMSDTRMSLRRSKRTSNACDRQNDDDTDALSELENLAKLGRIEASLSPEQWFSERALETRLHHIAHAVQNREWPAAAPHPPPPETSSERAEVEERRHKRHIAIDVETERAKLHALLSSPGDAPSGAPPPAHQRPAPAAEPAPAPVDLSAPRDEAQDFSLARRSPPAPPAPPAPPRSRLDDTLSRLMKRKNVPAPEQIVGKEKKRKKLDEIVLGLSAAKGQTSSSTLTSESRNRGTPILPDVTVTPAAPPTSTSVSSSQKPFSVTVTNVPSSQSSTKELSSFLQQSLEQSSKGQKPSPSVTMKSYSHEVKVNKWLAEQANLESRRRGLTPRLAPDEHVPVVHRVTGKRIVGHKAPQLKQLAQWIADNPMYDIDSKWTEGIKEHVKLPQDVRGQRHSPMPSTSALPERKKGRPPTLDSASANVLSSSSHLNQNLAGLNPALLASLSSLSAFDPKTLAASLSNLTGFDPKLLNTFDPKLLSSLGSFDTKSNPLLNSFSSMPNLLGNIAGGNIFANLAGLSLPGFSSLDMNALSGASNPGDKTKARKSTETASSSSSKSQNSQFPFVFPNPNMLYPQLGLGALNPFGMHSGMSSAYDALSLLGNNLAASSSSATLHSSSHSSNRSASKTTTPRSSTVLTNSSSSRQQKVSDRQQSSQLPQILLPPDPYLLESLSKQSLNYEAILRGDKKPRDSDSHETGATDLSKVDKKKITFESLRSQVPPEFAAVQEKLLKGDKKDIDISKMLLEQMASGALSASLVSSAEAKKAKDSEKDAYEKLSKSSSEYINRTLSSEDASTSMSHKRSHDEICEPENLALQTIESNPSKKLKECSDKSPKVDKHPDPHAHTGEMDLEDLIAPSTVIKTGMKTVSDFDPNLKSFTSTESPPSSSNTDKEENSQAKLSNSYQDEPGVQPSQDQTLLSDCSNKPENEGQDTNSTAEDANNASDISSGDGSRKGNKKKYRKSSDEATMSCPRRELRSSAGRQSTETMSSHH
ncbi:chromodomain-helicase-DNA-binding protein 7 isoform X1 [Amyelois transitella]|uniref:chromodomain-helicase-DNA-binding protein 7 isoform X1 n=1 Tax=Amyelois transitella TaxID=680683 RepID=UPI00299080BD|nr:chromodomain-helicase-DNA-binding protein 7 isoform X1 [Amyelois transitella]XP_060802494.1 chromodomain-helicase-DNA-binding protein 7 isoform X1 [Amyelois transitella]